MDYVGKTSILTVPTDKKVKGCYFGILHIKMLQL